MYIVCCAASPTDGKARVSTAPVAHQRRRQWQAASIELKTDVGSNIRIKAPGLCSLYHVSFLFKFTKLANEN